ncbi:MAG: cytochrome c [gamma proteobacterium symbiont of Taylorina sp.]|nr:cytochrome c [gamma proteobacterium symbiont of Taylorina sp.]
MNTSQYLPAAITLCVLITMTSASYAADPANGKTLHNESCIACHTSLTNGKPDTLYTRPDRKFNSLHGLKSQVMRCQTSVGANWFDDQIDDVVQYLNTTFYKVK